jgi:hypothetical protein
MEDKKRIFSKEYVQDSKTGIEGDQKTQEPTDPKIDSEKYGISKPRRITIRGTVIYDKS